MSPHGVCIALTTCGSEPVAQTMARELVDRGLAASVRLSPVQGFFRIDGATVEEEEIQLQVVTTQELYPEVEAQILRLHTYEVPEIFMLRPEGCSAEAQTWIHHATREPRVDRVVIK